MIERRMKVTGTEFKTREDGESPIIEGYFAVFNSIYDLGPGMSESIAPGAFASSASNDVRALVNHDSTLVLGRVKAHTLELQEDARGLWGRVVINPKDNAAMDLYERVKRGDVDQCSFGFEIRSEDTEIRENGDVHWTITDVNLIEVSAVTFPAYEETNINARSEERAAILKRQRDAWIEQATKKLKGNE